MIVREQNLVIVRKRIKEMQMFTILPLEYSQRSAIGYEVHKIKVEVLTMLNTDLLSELQDHVYNSKSVS